MKSAEPSKRRASAGRRVNIASIDARASGFVQRWLLDMGDVATAGQLLAVVVAVAVEKGGYGDEAAAPAARLILAKWFNLPETVVRGSSTSR